MDLNEIWQEHKRFIVTVCTGALVFLIASSVIGMFFDDDIRRQKGRFGSAQRKLADPLYDAADRTQARERHDELTARYAALETAAAFQPREGFRLDGASPAEAQNTLMESGDRLRAELGDLASRTRAVLPDGLGLEPPGTRNVDVLERHLHARDLLDRVLRLGLDSGLRRVRSVRIDLDRAFLSGRGLGPVETTQVVVEVEGDPEAITRWIALCETPSADGVPGVDIRGQALPISSLEVRGASAKRSDVLAHVTFSVVRIHPIETEDA